MPIPVLAVGEKAGMSYKPFLLPKPASRGFVPKKLGDNRRRAEAATKIQGGITAFGARRGVRVQAASTLQAGLRGHTIRQNIVKQASALTLQAGIEGFQVRHEVGRKIAAEALQGGLKGMHARVETNREVSTISLQGALRAMEARKAAKQELASIKLQAGMLGLQARQQVAKQNAVKVLQGSLKGMQTRREVASKLATWVKMGFDTVPVGMFSEGPPPLGTFTIPAATPCQRSYPAREALLEAAGSRALNSPKEGLLIIPGSREPVQHQSLRQHERLFKMRNEAVSHANQVLHLEAAETAKGQENTVPAQHNTRLLRRRPGRPVQGFDGWKMT